MTSRRCSAVSVSGQPCRSWAVRDTHPPLCSSHAGRNVGAGAPRGNQNARKHGLYSDTFSEDEIVWLAGHPGDYTLRDEIDLLRLFVRRLNARLEDPETPIRTHIAAGRVIVPAVRAIAYLIHLRAGTPDPIWDDILDELAEEFGEFEKTAASANPAGSAP